VAFMPEGVVLYSPASVGKQLFPDMRRLSYLKLLRSNRQNFMISIDINHKMRYTIKVILTLV
jgi:hypothetical protein